MKQIILIAILFSTYASFAQKKAPQPFIISINGGAAFPVGNFAKGDYTDEKSGFSKIGLHLNVSGVYYVSKHFGIGALVGYSQYGFNGAQSLSDGYKEDSGTDSTTLYNRGHNTNFSVLAGPYYSVKLTKNLLLDIRAMGGYVKTHLAGFKVYYEDYTDNAMAQNESSAGAFGYQLGAGLRYNITRLIALQLQADYFSSRPDIDITYDNFVVNSGRKLQTYSEAISGFNTTLGLAFRLGK